MVVIIYGIYLAVQKYKEMTFNFRGNNNILDDLSSEKDDSYIRHVESSNFNSSLDLYDEENIPKRERRCINMGNGL